MTVGGLGEGVASNMADLSAAPTARAQFVRDSLDILKDCGFDGELRLHASKDLAD